ncbi:MAG: fused MFS/spermidine synthase [Candidatus Omnitrophota bacterium]
MKRPLLFAIFIAGFFASASQIILLRELLVVFEGNELAFGFVLAAWLLLVGAGSLIAGRLSAAVKDKTSLFAAVLLAAAILLSLTIIASRLIRPVSGIPFGQALDAGYTFLFSFIILALLCLTLGAQFSLGCGLIPAGWVYILEAIGAGVSGVILSLFLVQRINAFPLALLLASLNAAVAFFISVASKRRLLSYASLFIFAGLGLIIVSGLGEKISLLSTKLFYKGFRVVASYNSPYANLTVTKRAEQYNIFANSSCMFTSPTPDIVFAEESIHFPLLANKNPRKVLLIGGGPGSAIFEITKHPVEKLVYAELDPAVINVASAYIPGVKNTLRDAKLEVKYTDGRAYVKNSADKYDVVLLNLPAPSTLQLNRLYSSEFFGEVKGLLNKGGIFALSLPAQEAYMNEQSKNLNRCIDKTLRSVFGDVFVIPGNIYIYIAPLKPLDAQTLINTYNTRHIETRVISPEYIKYKLDPSRVHGASAFLNDNKATKINFDFRPAATFYTIAFWNSVFHPRAGKIFDLLLNLNIWHFITLLAFICVLFFMLAKRKIFPALIFAISSSGFFAMGVELILIFAFQITFGYAYQMIGLLIGAFMAGLSLGAYIMTRCIEKGRVSLKILKIIDALIAFYPLLLALALIILSSYAKHPITRTVMAVLLPLFAIIAAALVGAEFPLANKLRLKSVAPNSRVAGGFYAADLFGGVFSAIVTGWVLVPVIGISSTLMLIACLKFSSWVFLVSSKA